MDLEALNEKLIERLDTLWNQQDKDWKRNRDWSQTDRKRRMGREDVAFDHQKNMWGFQEDFLDKHDRFQDWSRDQFKDTWNQRQEDQENKRSPFGGSLNNSGPQLGLMSSRKKDKRRSLLSGFGGGY